MSVIILKKSLQTPKLQTIYSASIIVHGNNYSNQPRIIENPTTASLKRGTGGRSSFNGIVCTIFGATGLVGPSVCNQLGKIGTQLIIPYRSDHYFAKRLKLCGDLGQVLFHPYHLQDEESIYKSLKYSSVVINLVSKDWPTSNFSFHDVHVKGARRIAKIAKQAGVKRFIHVSDLNASPNPKPLVLKNGSDYLKAKWEGECAVKDVFPDATIIRPAVIYGSADRFFTYHTKPWCMYKKCPVLWKKGEQTEKQPVYVDDVGAGIVAAILDDSSIGKTYQFVGPRRYKLKDIILWIQRNVAYQEWLQLDLEIKDLEETLPFQWKVTLNEYLGVKSRYGFLHWEQIERDSTSDVVLPELPKLEDLGVNPVLLDKRGVWVAAGHKREGEDILPPEPIECVPNC